VPYCFDVRFRTPRPIVADKLEEVFNAAPFKRPLRFYRPDGMNRHDGWLAVQSCGYADFGEAEASGARSRCQISLIDTGLPSFSADTGRQKSSERDKSASKL
jgi:hypothetical protein